MEFKIENDCLILRRNDYQCINPLINVPNGIQVLLFVVWNFTTLTIAYTPKGGNKTEVEIKTSPTSPPIKLLKYVRNKNLIPIRTYESDEAFRSKVHECLNSIQQKINESGLYDIFWNKHKGKNGKILQSKPKDETEIHPIIRALLSDQAVISSFEVIPEYKTGVGNLDFLLLAQLSDGRSTRVCIEFKHAHSKSLLDGINKQLPAYMRNVGAAYGVYGVLNFFGRDLEVPFNGQKYSLEIIFSINKIKSKEPLINKNIREIIFSFAKPTSASKL